MNSLADQRIPEHGVVAKNVLESRIATVSCQNLEKLFLEKMVPDSGKFVERMETLRIFKNKSNQIVARFFELSEGADEQIEDLLQYD